MPQGYLAGVGWTRQAGGLDSTKGARPSAITGATHLAPLCFLWSDSQGGRPLDPRPYAVLFSLVLSETLMFIDLEMIRS